MERRDELLKGAARVASAVQDFLALLANEEVTEVVETTATKKKVAKKTKKVTKKKEEVSAKTMFTTDTPPDSPAERKLFQTQWEELGKDGQTQYLDGVIDSIGTVLKVAAPTEEMDELDELDDLAEESALTIKDLKTAAQAKMASDGKPAVVAIFKSFGYSKISEALPVHFDAIYQELS